MRGSRPGGAVFWTAVVMGTAIMGWGIFYFFSVTPDWDRRINFGVWFVGLDLAHDLLLAPMVVAIGWSVARAVSPRWKAPTQAGLILSGTVLLIAWLPLNETAAGTNNPTIQPNDYRTATLVLLIGIWASMTGWALLRRPSVEADHDTTPRSQGSERLKNSWNSSSPVSATDTTDNPTGGSMS